MFFMLAEHANDLDYPTSTELATPAVGGFNAVNSVLRMDDDLHGAIPSCLRSSYFVLAINFS